MLSATLIVYLDDEVDPPVEIWRRNSHYTSTHPRSRAVALDVVLEQLSADVKRDITDAGFTMLEYAVTGRKDPRGDG